MSGEVDLELALADLAKILGIKTQHDTMRLLFEKASGVQF